MIWLTLKSNGNPIYIAPENITAICDNKEGGAEVYSGHDFTLVRETAAEVARKVLEWRLEMEAYKQSVLGNNFNISADCASRLRLLAGLEEPA